MSAECSRYLLDIFGSQGMMRCSPSKSDDCVEVYFPGVNCCRWCLKKRMCGEIFVDDVTYS